MELAWMGRYRKLVAAIVCHSNHISRSISVRMDRGNGIMLTQQEHQVLEVLVEHEDETLIMADISELLGIIPSSFSKITKQLLSYGLVERYHFESNKKNIILKPSEKGRALYIESCKRRSSKLFSDFFEKLEPLTDEQIAIFTDAITSLTKVIAKDQKQLFKDQRLIKM